MTSKNIFGGIRNWLLATALGGTLACSSCDKKVVEPILPPTAELTVSPQSGTSLESRIVTLNGKSNSESSDIKRYIVKYDDKIIDKGIPIDTTLFFENSGDVYGIVVDSKSLSDTSKVFVDAQKPDTTNYAPEADFSAITPESLKIDEDSTATITLPTPTDRNPEDNPFYKSASSAYGEVSTTLNGNELTITGKPGEIGEYQVNVVLTDGKKDVTKTLTGKLEDLLDVSGNLRDNESQLSRGGIVKVYDSDKVQIGEIPVDVSGNFNKRFNKRISDLTDDILVQGRWTENAVDSSYVRTMKLPAQDQKDLELAVVPYTGLKDNGISKEDFKKHVAEVLTYEDNSSNLNPLIQKWIFAGESADADYKLNEIIISENAEAGRQGYFSQATADEIRNRILDDNDIGSAFNGKVKDNMVKIEKNYLIPSGTAGYGKIVIYPDENPLLNGSPVGGYASASDQTQDGYLDVGKVVVKVTGEGNLSSIRTIAHEMGHASGLEGHAETLPNEKTILKSSPSGPTSPTFTDKKTAKAIYENSYVHDTGTQSGGFQGNTRVYRLGLDDILGLNFY